MEKGTKKKAIQKSRPAKKFRTEEKKEFKPRLTEWFDSCEVLCHTHARAAIAMLHDSEPEVQKELLRLLRDGAKDLDDVVSGVCKTFKRPDIVALLNNALDSCIVDALLEDLVRSSSNRKEVVTKLIENTKLEEGDISSNDECGGFV